MSLGIVGIDHVQITVPSALESECLVFYRSVLNLAEIPKPDELRARGGAWFKLSNVQLHVGIDTGTSPASRRHVCFLVADIEGARAWARAQKLAVEGEGAVTGSPRFFVHDPAGNRLEIAQR
ncbi:MAG TPA: VOC family protein [Rhizomicrobium sp.]|jgi:catechol 2,3-dioxygenase-like lactoylglutathione lyase family enzyme